MSKNRSKTGLVHIKNNETLDVSKEKATGRFFIKGTDVEVPSTQLSKKSGKDKSSYDFSKPSQAQNLGDEWSDYAWSADDY